MKPMLPNRDGTSPSADRDVEISATASRRRRIVTSKQMRRHYFVGGPQSANAYITYIVYFFLYLKIDHTLANHGVASFIHISFITIQV